MHSWKKARLGDFAEVLLGKMLDKVKNKGELHPYLSNKDVRWGSFDTHNLSLMRFEEHEHDRFGLKYGDIVVCEGGQPGRCAIWKDELPDMKIQKALHRVRVNEEYSNEFVYYRFLLAGRSGQLEKYFIGSTIKHLTGVNLKLVEFEYPDLPEQKRIASVLSALDAKIALNTRINAELEALAKLIYDYWFVQFDFPNAKGQPYKSSGGAMVYSKELKREVPEGWEVGTLSDLAEIIGGSTPSTANPSFFMKNGTAWITPKDLSNNSGNRFITRGETDVSPLGITSTSLKLMPAGTVLLSTRAPIGYMAISRETVTTNQGFKSFVPNKGYSTEFIYETVRSYMPAIVRQSAGTTFQEVSKSALSDLKVCLAPKPIVEDFTKLVSPMFQQQNVLEAQNQELAALRDWLLPLLMNGQVVVGEAVEKVGLAMAAEAIGHYGKKRK